MLSSSCGAMTNKEPTATAPSYLRAVMGTMPTPVVAKRSRVNAELAFMNRLVVVARSICRSSEQAVLFILFRASQIFELFLLPHVNWLLIHVLGRLLVTC